MFPRHISDRGLVGQGRRGRRGYRDRTGLGRVAYVAAAMRCFNNVGYSAFETSPRSDISRETEILSDLANGVPPSVAIDTLLAETVFRPKLCISAKINVLAEASVSAEALAFLRDLFRFRPISVWACFS